MPEKLDQLADVAQAVVRVNKYVRTGEVEPPYIPIPEAAVVRAENRQAIDCFASNLIIALTDPQMAEFILANHSGAVVDSRHQGGSLYAHHVNYSTTVQLVRVDDKPIFVFRNTEGYSGEKDWLDGHIEEYFDHFKQRDLRGYPSSEGNPWNFTQTRTPRGDNYDDFVFRGERFLEPGDLTNGLLWSFVGGTNRMLNTVEGKIHALTIKTDEADRIRRLTAACVEATKIVEAAITGTGTKQEEAL